jgi:hypothetical protein
MYPDITRLHQPPHTILTDELLGFEPRQTESKSDVLPLHHSSVLYFYNTFFVKKIGVVR